VKISIGRGTQGSPIIRTETVASIGAGQTTTLTFGRLGKVPFAIQTSVMVQVAGSQARVYPVAFTSPD